MDSWEDWYNNIDIYMTLITELERLCGDRLQKFIDVTREVYQDDEDYFTLLDTMDKLDKLNNSILKGTDDYVYIIDTLESDNIFKPTKERFIDCIKRIENWCKIRF